MPEAQLDLDPWLPILEAALPPGEDGMLVHLARGGRAGALDLGVLPLEGLHPLDLLDGAVAPPGWVALGVVSRGWASPWLEGSAVRPSRHPARVRVVATVVADRSGALAGRVVAEDGAVLVGSPPREGEVAEALLAALSRGGA